MADINLLPSEERQTERLQFVRKKILLASIIVLVLTAIATLATLGFFTSLVSKRTALVDQIDKSSSVVNDNKASEELIVVVKGKMSAAEKILSSRDNPADTLTKLSGRVPQGVYFTDIRLSSGKLVISGKAKSSAEMAGFVSSLVSEEGTKFVSEVTVDSLSADESGVYSFVVTLLLVTS